VREQEDYEMLCRTVACVLSPYENQIWQRYVAGATAAEIAARMGKDTRSVHNAIYRIRHKLRRTIDPSGS
jgi:DNA-directed RNA polymerase specialized sigma24 family protein